MKVQKMINGYAFAVVLAVAVTIAIPAICDAGETCPTNSSGPDICVSFAIGTPVEFQHFTVDYATNPANPSVTLKAANLTWNVRSDDGESVLVRGSSGISKADFA